MVDWRATGITESRREARRTRPPGPGNVSSKGWRVTHSSTRIGRGGRRRGRRQERTTEGGGVSPQPERPALRGRDHANAARSVVELAVDEAEDRALGIERHGKAARGHGHRLDELAPALGHDAL